MRSTGSYQLPSDGKWRVGVFYSNQTGYVHPCCEPHKPEGHATQQEADRCKYDYDFARRLKGTWGGGAHHPCTCCGKLTPHFVQVNGIPKDVCETCAEKPELLQEKAFPFEPGMVTHES